MSSRSPWTFPFFRKTPHLAQRASKQRGLQALAFKQHSAWNSKHSNDVHPKTSWINTHGAARHERGNLCCLTIKSFGACVCFFFFFFFPLRARQMCCTYKFQEAAVFALKQKNPTVAPSLATPVHAVPSFYKLCLTSPHLTPTSLKWGRGSW